VIIASCFTSSSYGTGEKTYENSTMGISFNYPGNWEIAHVE